MARFPSECKMKTGLSLTPFQALCEGMSHDFTLCQLGSFAGLQVAELLMVNGHFKLALKARL